ncbi:hypothetical protein [Modestobacter italicus]|uniref:hypothetical protein n=1 Tax=Modestobacter italicus (strain DSM 44449 / CECT 9708 / BC 501) TaxID=2732864 RepID=UPI001C953419|nr:hypothetical protein [Modestobacter italicus]
MTAPAAPQDVTDADVPFGPLTFVQEMTRAGHATIAQLHDEAMAAIAALAESWDQPAAGARVLRMSDRPAVHVRPVGTAAA